MILGTFVFLYSVINILSSIKKVLKYYDEVVVKLRSEKGLGFAQKVNRFYKFSFILFFFVTYYFFLGGSEFIVFLNRLTNPDFCTNMTNFVD